AGILEPHALEVGKGLGVVIADVNDDGKPDIYIADDEMAKLLYINKGGMKFEEVGVLNGAATDDNGAAQGSMGVDAADYDGTGRISLFVTNYEKEPHGLYRNAGNGNFIYASRGAGVAAIGLDYVGFGTGFIDFDRNGAEDIFITNGHVIRFPTGKAPL